MRTLHADILVAGASLGGLAAAWSAARRGKSVILAESTDWIGGQLTSQAVPPDEHRWIEEFGCTASYRAYRNRVRAFYRERYPLTPEARADPRLDPGKSSVSRLAHEPRIAELLLREMIQPELSSGRLRLLLRHEAAEVELRPGDPDRLAAVVLRGAAGERVRVEAAFFVDGTEQGDLLPLAGAEFVSGAESRADTGEPDAPPAADPEDLQPATWVAAMSHDEGADHVGEPPRAYERYRSLMQGYDVHPVLSWYGPDSATGKARKFGMFDDGGEGLFPLWSYRRVQYPGHYEPGFVDRDLTLLNWPQNDYFLGNLYGKDSARHWEGARDLTLCLFHWLQTEAPRPDGGRGWPGLELRPDALDSPDGLAKHPYIRESRRIAAKARLTERDVAADLREGPVEFRDSVGVGCYHVDLHITTRSRTFMYKRIWPFQIPLGALVPVRMRNLLPACKNIGTTHLTNGCCRLHPVEWNIGEAAGHLAAQCLERGLEPADIHGDRIETERLLAALEDAGVERSWPRDRIEAI